MTTSSVTAVIPNWNGRILLDKNLPLVLAAFKRHEIIVVDDASTDGSAEYVRTRFPEVLLIVNTARKGYAYCVNEGVRVATGDVVVLLNTDVRPEKNFLKPLLRHFQDQKVFAVGCLEISYENGKTVARGRGVAQWVQGFFIHRRGETDMTTTAWVSGGSGAFKRSIWIKLGGMDTIFTPFYWEDIDISYRALKAGYALRFEKNSCVHHRHEEGKILTNYSQSYIRTVSYRNQFLFIWKNADFETLWVHIRFLGLRLLQAVLRKDIAMIIGFFWALSKVPYVPIRRMRFSQMKKVSDKDVYLL